MAQLYPQVLNAQTQLHFRIQFSGRPHRNKLFTHLYASKGQALNHINNHCLVMNCSSIVEVFNKCFLVTDLYNNKNIHNNSSCGMIELLFYNITYTIYSQ
jgi:hypothetical protein